MCLCATTEAAWTNAWGAAWATNSYVWKSYRVAADLDTAVRERCLVTTAADTNNLQVLTVWPSWKWLGQIDYVLKDKLVGDFCDMRPEVFTNNTYDVWFSTHSASNNFPKWNWTNICLEAFGKTNFTHPAYWPSRTNLFTPWPRKADVIERRKVIELMAMTEYGGNVGPRFTYSVGYSGSYSTNTWTQLQGIAATNITVTTKSTTAFGYYTVTPDPGEGYAYTEKRQIDNDITDGKPTNRRAYWGRGFVEWYSETAVSAVYACQMDTYGAVVTNLMDSSNSVALAHNSPPVSTNYYTKVWNNYPSADQTSAVFTVTEWNGDSGRFPTTNDYWRKVSGSYKPATTNRFYAVMGNTNIYSVPSWVSDPPLDKYVQANYAKGYRVYSHSKFGSGTYYDGRPPVFLKLKTTGDGTKDPLVLLRWDTTNGFKYVKQ